MPELPEVEIVRRGLESALAGAVVASVVPRRADLRVPFPPGLAETLAARRIESVGRRAKYLLMRFDSGDVMIAHLGMSGHFQVVDKAPKAYGPHDHLVIDFVDGRRLVYNDPRRFGLVTLAKKNALETHPLLQGLGPEPLDKAFSAAYLRQALARRKGPVKPVLMDQKLVVGVGNIYACEALFLAGIDPLTPAERAALRAEDLVPAIRRTLNDAIAAGGSSMRDFLHITGYRGDYQNRFQVYGRQGKPCFSCHRPIDNIRLAGRSTFYCRRCQK